MRNHDQRVAQVEGEGQKEGTKRDSWIRNVNSPRSLRKCGLHPLIHSLLEFNLAQDIESLNKRSFGSAWSLENEKLNCSHPVLYHPEGDVRAVCESVKSAFQLLPWPFARPGNTGYKNAGQDIPSTLSSFLCPHREPLLLVLLVPLCHKNGTLDFRKMI